jgi:integrase/recombinase XerC
VFERGLAGRPLAERSRREYARNVRVYCAWLATTPDRAGWQGDPLTDPLARDHAARGFRRWLQVERRAAASTVNLALASLDALYRCLGLGRPHVRRDKPAMAAPRALDEAGQRRRLRAAEGAPVRARAHAAPHLSDRAGAPRQRPGDGRRAGRPSEARDDAPLHAAIRC